MHPFTNVHFEHVRWLSGNKAQEILAKEHLLFLNPAFKRKRHLENGMLVGNEFRSRKN